MKESPTAAALEARRGRQRAALYAIFFVSGFCGLIYESIWSHYLKLMLGHAAYAQAVVLVVFVGGLALGAWLTGRFSERIRSPILLYAAIEAAVAIIAYSFQGVFEKVSAWAAADLLPSACAAAGPCMATWWLAAALILPAAVLLGATFPLMSAGVIRLGARPGRGLSLLYFLNSAGAALGVLASGFVLIPWIGLPGTLLVAGSLNAAVALAAYLAVRPFGQEPAAQARSAIQSDASSGSLRLLLAVAALTGLSSFIYEVVWIRMLTLVLGAATHAFELMLAPFILGIALGAWWIRNRIEGSNQALLLLARIQVVMGVMAVATLPLYAGSFEAMSWALRALGRTGESYTLFNLASLGLAAAVMLPATVCAGMTLPLITAVLLRQGHGERQVGQVYGINTFGAIAGVLLAVHVLIPQLGLKWSLALGGAIDIVLGLAIWFALVRRSPALPRFSWGGRMALAGVAAFSLAWLIALPLATSLEPNRLASGVFRYGQARLPDQQQVIFHRDGKTATITVVQGSGGERSLLTNGKADGATHREGDRLTPDDHTMVLLGALGPVHHPKARKAAVIGLGTGVTSSVLLNSPALEQVDTIEIEPMMVEGARNFLPRNAAVFDDPRSRIVIDDARAHFSRAGTRYDLIVSEPSNPWVSGVAGLFTTEFYEHISSNLAPDGHFVQWLHLYEASPEMVASIVRAYGSVFPTFRAYLANEADVVLVARNDGVLPELQHQALDGMPAMQKQLLRIGIGSAAMLAAHDTGRSNAIKLLADTLSAPPNSDYFPYVDQRAASDRFRRDNAQMLFTLRQAPVPILDFKSGAPDHAGKVTAAGAFMPRQVRAMAGSANGLRFLRGDKLTEAEYASFADQALNYTALRSWASDCRFPSGNDLSWVAAVRVAGSMNGGVSADAAGGWWKSLGTRCRASMTPVQRAWVDLFAATGARDAAASALHADRVLELDPGMPPEGRGYAALASVAGHITTGARTQASKVLKEQVAQLPKDQHESGWFRYLTFALTIQEKAQP
jgi:predicted membrane-bound spermidine synthase